MEEVNKQYLDYDSEYYNFLQRLEGDLGLIEQPMESTFDWTLFRLLSEYQNLLSL